MASADKIQPDHGEPGWDKVSVATPWDWNVAVFCRNERWSIVQCIESIADASREHRTLITLIVNGSSDDSAALALEAAARRNIPIAVYTIAHSDKANAINRFFYSLREPAHHYFFIDAYVKIGRNALAAMEACLTTRPEAMAATGVAVNGRTMQRATGPTLAEGHRMHGQLHALRPEFIDRLVARNLRLPIGLYYGDGLIGSMVLHDLDALKNEWVPKRIASDPEATYAIPILSPFRPRDLKRQLQRKVRQMRGRLENLAIRDILYVHNYEGLPEYAHDMVMGFLTAHGPPVVGVLDRPFQALALREIRAARRPDPGRLEPVLMRRL
jgi:glycosyltransferase involved in cell wall biosynthesis